MNPGDDDATMQDQVTVTPTEKVQAEHQEEVDRISTLPDHLVHRIMSLLPNEDTARTALLSKRWKFLWLTFPVIDLDEVTFYLRDHTTCRQMFRQHLRQSLSRRQFNHMQKLRINTVLPHDYELDHLVNRCVATAILRGKVQQLDLRIKSRTNVLDCDHYVLPRVIFSSGSCLVSLVLEDCQCGVYNKVSFPVLKDLTMRWVHVGNKLIQKMISNSPNVETVRLEFCHGFDTLKVFNNKLRSLILIACKELVAFEVDTPRLSYFRCNGIRRVFGRMPGNHRPDYDCAEITEFKASNAKVFPSLEKLVLSFVRMNYLVLRSILSTFRNVENIELLCGIFPSIPSILLEKLKSVEMQNCHFNELVQFNAPNLESLVYKGGYRHCRFSYLRGMGFCSLKTVSIIEYAGLRDESLPMLLSCCTLLENLGVKACGMLRHIRVTSSTLKSLVVHSCYNLLDGEIHAPNLVSFQYVGKLVQFSPVISSANLDAELHLENPFLDVDYAQKIELRRLLRNFDQARTIKIISNRTDCFVFPEEVASPAPALVFLPHLKVKAKFAHTSLLEILLGILGISYCHETLWINVENTILELKFQLIEEARDMELLQAELLTHDCIQQHLTEVRLENFDGSWNHTQLMTYLLHSAGLLNNMFISFNEEHKKYASNLSETVSRIINSPRASPTAQITFM